jgi:hypothetical protein
MEVKMALPEFDIFLSYSSEDATRIEHLRDALQERGVKVWLDRREIRPGDRFRGVLEKDVESSRSVGIVVTKNSLASNWILEECERALKHGLRLISLLFEDVDLPDFLKSPHYVDFRPNSDYDKEIDTLIWPEITGRKVKIFFHPIQFVEINWFHLTQVVSDSPVELHPSGEPVTSEDIIQAISDNYRTVVISDPFCCWQPEEKLDKDHVKYVKQIFNFRNLTRNTEDETVFALYIHPKALSEAPHQLDKEDQKRLRGYFHIPMTFVDTKEESKSEADDSEQLRSNWKKTWHRIQIELLRSERHFSGTRFDEETRRQDINSIKKQIQSSQRRLQKLQESTAIRGANTPPETLIEIEDLEEQLSVLRWQLNS